MGLGMAVRRSVTIGLLAFGVASLAAPTIPQQKTSTSNYPFKLKTADLVGEFNIGGMGAEKLSLTADGKYRYESRGCLGSDGFAKGTWHLDGDVIKFSSYDDGPRRLVPIKWGKRTYLFEENKISKAFDYLFQVVGHGQDAFPGLTFVKKPIPAMTPEDYNAEPIIPDRYLTEWNASKLKFRGKNKDFLRKLGG